MLLIHFVTKIFNDLFQVTVLSEQVEAQEEKIRDMDVSMDEYKHRLAEANDVLQEVNKQNINFFL